MNGRRVTAGAVVVFVVVSVVASILWALVALLGAGTAYAATRRREDDLEEEEGAVCPECGELVDEDEACEAGDGEESRHGWHEQEEER